MLPLHKNTIKKRNQKSGVGERFFFYSVFFNSIFIFTMLYFKKALQILVMNALSSQDDFKCPFKFPDEDTDIMLGSVHHNLWKK